MSQKLMKTLVATRPVYLGTDVYTTGQPYIARSEGEAKEMLGEPSWKAATKADLAAWSKRLSVDPAIAYLRSRPAITETEYDEHPDDAEKAKAAARDQAARAAEEARQAAAAQKAADAARAAAGGASAKVEGDSQAGPSDVKGNPGGVG
ncbi:MAG: hypothetical protein IPK75_01365 [Acidobacteria bacterium]|nr:hypothetical protein [Acidobacteriota bacterium]